MKGCIKIPCGSHSSNNISKCSGSSNTITVINNNELPYLSLGLYPTRNGSTHILSSWHLRDSSFQLKRVTLYYTTSTRSEIYEQLSSWEWQDGEMFYHNLKNVTAIDITSQAREGELFETWDFSGKNVVIAVYTLFADDGATWCTWNVHDSIGTNLITNSAPSLSYNGGILTIGKCCAGRRILEFHRTDRAYGYPTSIRDEATLNEMLFTSIVNMENGDSPYEAYYDLNTNVLNRWRSGRYSVGVNFLSSQNRSAFVSAINNAISEINSVMSEFGISFYLNSGTSGNIRITVDTEYNLYGINPETDSYVYGGTWESTTNSSGYITGVQITYACDVYDYSPFATLETVVFEELLQSLGAGYDQVEYPHNTIHTDFNYYNKQATMYERDADILRLVYSSAISAGDSCTTVSTKLNIPKGCYMPSTSTTNEVQTIAASNFLTAGGQYEVRAFIVNRYGEVSLTSDWVTISVPQISKWDWNVSNGSASAAKTKAFYDACRGTVYAQGNMSYRVWNDLCAKIREARIASGANEWSNYYGLTYNQTLVSKGEALSAQKFNSMRYNLGSVYSTGIYEKAKNDEILGTYFITLANKLNEFIDTI